MIRLIVLFSFVSSGMAMSVKASKRMTYSSPDGNNNMFLERSAAADMDSSASGYIYQSNGLGPAMVVELGPHPASQAFDQINEAYESLIHPVMHPGYYPINQEYEDAGGEDGNAAYYQNGGEKGEKGYNGFDQFQKGLLNKYGKKQDAGFYNNAAGQKKGHHDVGGYYGGHQAAQKGQQGGKYGEQSNQKKGHKTTGYHNVYHKDEYKKEHSFYDEANKEGHQDQYAKGQSEYGAEKGAFQKGGHQDAAFQAGEGGNKGFFDKGNFAEEAAGYNGGKESDSHYNSGVEFGNQGGSNFHKGFGFGHGGFGY